MKEEGGEKGRVKMESIPEKGNEYSRKKKKYGKVRGLSVI